MSNTGQATGTRPATLPRDWESYAERHESAFSAEKPEGKTPTLVVYLVTYMEGPDRVFSTKDKAEAYIATKGKEALYYEILRFEVDKCWKPGHWRKQVSKLILS